MLGKDKILLRYILALGERAEAPRFHKPNSSPYHFPAPMFTLELPEGFIMISQEMHNDKLCIHASFSCSDHCEPTEQQKTKVKSVLFGTSEVEEGTFQGYSIMPVCHFFCSDPPLATDRELTGNINKYCK